MSNNCLGAILSETESSEPFQFIFSTHYPYAKPLRTFAGNIPSGYLCLQTQEFILIICHAPNGRSLRACAERTLVSANKKPERGSGFYQDCWIA